MYTILPHAKNAALRHKAAEIPMEEIGSEKVQTLIREMQQLLAREKCGVALAAPQVGEPFRLFIVSGRALARDAAPEESPTPDDAQLSATSSQLPAIPDQIYINPEIQKMSRGRRDMHEGCLSIRGRWGMVPRAEKATIRALDEHGRVFTRGASGFLARNGPP
jgi:peptide deformylase